MGKGVMQWPIPAGPDVLDRDLTSSSAKTVGRMYYFSICRRKHQRTIYLCLVPTCFPSQTGYG